MYILFFDAGKFQAGKIISETDSSAQVDTTTGRRVKVKRSRQLLKFENPAADQLLERAEVEAQDIDAALAWEFAPEEEFSFVDFAAEYFGSEPNAVQKTAALLTLQGAPHYFRRAGTGQFRKAPADIVKKALAAIARKERIQAQIQAWVDRLVNGDCPQAVADQLYNILFKPDKNAAEYKAVVQAARETQMAPLALLQRAGAIHSAYAFHWQRFLFQDFPEGIGFPPLQAPTAGENLPLADVQAFSIDDAQTTEIDDAISVTDLGQPQVRVGVHIAAPALAIQPGDALDKICRKRLSTVYMPGYKITMLPENIVAQYTLQAGQAAPVLSLYVTVDADTLDIVGRETRLERVAVSANLRHDQIEELWTSEGDATGTPDDTLTAAVIGALHFLDRLSLQLKAGREAQRGKSETFTRPDYSFYLEGNDGQAPTGEETVRIEQRRRGSPPDRIVSELMILANSSWGEQLRELGVPAIYRSQGSLAPGVKVRMGTQALPHAGMGVASYCWATSPLRRYVDLVNQWQILAAARHGKTAALAAPFRQGDTDLLAIISAFDSAYSSYRQHQNTMERFWSLRYLQQQGVQELTATLLRPHDGGSWLVRANSLPLVFKVIGAQGLQRGCGVQVRLGEIDLLALELNGTIIGVLGSDNNQPGETEGDEDDEIDSGEIKLALRVDEETAKEGEDLT